MTCRYLLDTNVLSEPAKPIPNAGVLSRIRQKVAIDGQIAAIAQVHGLVVVTRNVHHFRDFQNLEVQDWSE